MQISPYYILCLLCYKYSCSGLRVEWDKELWLCLYMHRILSNRVTRIAMQISYEMSWYQIKTWYAFIFIGDDNST